MIEDSPGAGRDGNRPVGSRWAVSPDAGSVARGETDHLQPRYQSHANGARHLRGIVICTESIDETAERWGRWSGHPVRTADGVARIDLGAAEILVTDPDTLPTVLPGAKPPALPSLVGITVEVDDLTRTTAVLDHRGIPTTTPPGAVLVPASEAAGCLVAFRQRDGRCAWPRPGGATSRL